MYNQTEVSLFTLGNLLESATCNMRDDIMASIKVHTDFIQDHPDHGGPMITTEYRWEFMTKPVLLTSMITHNGNFNVITFILQVEGDDNETFVCPDVGFERMMQQKSKVNTFINTLRLRITRPVEPKPKDEAQEKFNKMFGITDDE